VTPDLTQTMLGTWYMGEQCPPASSYIFYKDSFVYYAFYIGPISQDSMIHVSIRSEKKGTWKATNIEISPSIRYANGEVFLTYDTGENDTWHVAGVDTSLCFSMENTLCDTYRSEPWYLQTIGKGLKGLVIDK
jgi:hypothetical protein